MSTPRKVREFFRKVDQVIQPPARFPATLGNTDGVVEVGDSPNLVYIRTKNGPLTVFNDKVLNVAGTPVWVGYSEFDTTNLRVLAPRDVGLNPIAAQPPGISRALAWNGADPLLILAQQIQPWLVRPTGGMTVKVYGMTFKGATGWKAERKTTLDLTASVPGTGARYTLIEVRSDGTIGTVDGTPVAKRGQLALSDIPAHTAGARMLAAIRLQAGQARINYTTAINDVVDLRFGIPDDYVVPGGTEGSVQYNLGGILGGDSKLVWNRLLYQLTLDGTLITKNGMQNNSMAGFPRVGIEDNTALLAVTSFAPGYPITMALGVIPGAIRLQTSGNSSRFAHLRTTNLTADRYFEFPDHGEELVAQETPLLDFATGIANPAWEEGRVFWDNAKHGLSFYNDINGVTANLPYEFWIRVKNATGATIPNGTVVYPVGVCPECGETTIGIADASKKEKCRLVAMLTMDIPDGGIGIATRLGEVHDLDTSALTGGVCYLKDDGSGGVTSTPPTGGSFVIAIGGVKVIDPTSGIIIVDVTISELTVEAVDTNGFPPGQVAASTITIDDGTRTLTIAPTVDEFHYYTNADKFTQTTAQEVQWADTEGMHAIYFDGQDLLCFDNPTDDDYQDLILTKAFVMALYWDADNNKSIVHADERHGISMPPWVHLYLHLTQKTKWLNGLGLTTFSVNGNGDLAAHAQFGVEAGAIADEDYFHDIPAKISTGGLPILYLDGIAANIRSTAQAGYAVLTDTTAGVGTTGRLVYNQYTGGAWQLTTVSSNNYVLCHVVATNDLDGDYQVFAIVGQAIYTTLANARIGAETEVGRLNTGQLPFNEFKILGTIIFQTATGYANAVKARVRTTDTGGEYIDWRTSGMSGVAASGGISEAPVDGVLYGRQNAGWQAAQPLDADLTAISALAPTDNDVIQRKSGAWTNRTPAQLAADLTTLAPLASPALTGNPTAPTPAADDNDTSLATTAYYCGQIGTANPVRNGTATAGTSKKFSPIDHVHPADGYGELICTAFSITGAAGTYQDTGNSISLTAGTWEVWVDAACYINLASGSFGWITIKLYNSTDAADVANSERIGTLVNTTGLQFTVTCALRTIITVTGTKTIKLYAMRNGVGTPTFTLSSIGSDANGRTVMGYRQIK